MKPADLEQLKKLCEKWKAHKCAEDFPAMETMRDIFVITIIPLISRIEELEKALEHTKKFCLCERNTFGFDYGEVHPLSGKPGAGKRWLTPQVVATKALEGAKE